MVVGVRGLEPPTSRTPCVRATNCATPRLRFSFHSKLRRAYGPNEISNGYKPSEALAKDGGPYRGRTCDLFHAMEAL